MTCEKALRKSCHKLSKASKDNEKQIRLFGYLKTRFWGRTCLLFVVFGASGLRYIALGVANDSC